jgi:flagellar protein FlaG
MNVAAVPHLDGQTLAAAPLVVPAEKLTEQRELIQAVKAVNAAELFGQNSELTFVMDRETSRPVVRLIDRKTQEIIRQIPPEYLLRMAVGLRDLEKVT